MRLLPNIIEGLFKQELSGHRWTQYTTKMVKEIITVKYNLQNPASSVELTRFLKKLKEGLPMEETLIKLTDELMGEVKD